MPVMIQSATQNVRKRSNTLMAGLRADPWPAAATDSLIKAVLYNLRCKRAKSGAMSIAPVALRNQRLARLNSRRRDALLDPPPRRPRGDGLAAFRLHRNRHLNEARFPQQRFGALGGNCPSDAAAQQCRIGT